MTRSDVLNIIQKHISEVVPFLADREINEEDSLEGLGANSIERSEIIMMTLETLVLDIPRVETFGPKNIGQLADLLFQKQKAV